MRRPVDAPFTMGDGDREHAARKVGPSQDYGVPVGTPVVAMFDTVRVVKSGSDAAKGGHTLTGYAANGDSWIVQHLSEWNLDQTQPEGAVVALSGDSGTEIRGAHVHAFVNIGGVRMNPEAAIAQLASLAAAPFDPEPESEPEPYIPEEYDMARQIIVTRDDKAVFDVLTLSTPPSSVSNLRRSLTGSDPVKRGVEKIIQGFARIPKPGEEPTVTVVLTGEEWEAGSVDHWLKLSDFAVE